MKKKFRVFVLVLAAMISFSFMNTISINALENPEDPEHQHTYDFENIDLNEDDIEIGKEMIINLPCLECGENLEITFKCVENTPATVDFNLQDPKDISLKANGYGELEDYAFTILDEDLLDENLITYNGNGDYIISAEALKTLPVGEHLVAFVYLSGLDENLDKFRMDYSISVINIIDKALPPTDEDKEPEKPTPVPDPVPETKPTTPKPVKPNQSTAVKTGDNNNISLYTTIVLGSLLIIAANKKIIKE